MYVCSYLHDDLSVLWQHDALQSVLHQQGEVHLVHLGHIGQSGLLSGANKRDGEE